MRPLLEKFDHNGSDVKVEQSHTGQLLFTVQSDPHQKPQMVWLEGDDVVRLAYDVLCQTIGGGSEKIRDALKPYIEEMEAEELEDIYGGAS